MPPRHGPINYRCLFFPAVVFVFFLFFLKIFRHNDMASSREKKMKQACCSSHYSTADDAGDAVVRPPAPACLAPGQHLQGQKQRGTHSTPSVPTNTLSVTIHATSAAVVSSSSANVSVRSGSGWSGRPPVWAVAAHASMLACAKPTRALRRSLRRGGRSEQEK